MEIGIKELKQIQLNILDIVNEFCVKNNIHYSLACGSLLGAIRHKGYIPWDDDVDIYMLRPDYNIFIANFANINKEWLQIFSIESDEQYALPYAKVSNSHTIMIMNGNVGTNIGVNIDVFPIDGVPSNLKRYIHLFKMNFLKYLFLLKVMHMRSGRPFYKEIFLVISKCFLFLISQRKLAVCINNNAKMYSVDTCDKLFEMVAGYKHHHFFPASAMKNFIEVDFEGKKYCSMSGYDDYLKASYGDYMQLPPKHKQLSHHVYKAYWK